MGIEMKIEDLSPQQLNLVTAMALEEVEWDENYQPMYAVDCFSPLASGNGVHALWSGDYEFSIWNPMDNWKDLGVLIEEFSVVLFPVFKDEYANSVVVGWDAFIPTYTGEDPYGFSCKVVDYDHTVENRDGSREKVSLERRAKTPNEAVVKVVIKLFDEVLRKTK